MKPTVDWAALDRLRSVFLDRKPMKAAYWQSPSDLDSYDATLGERIGWKWDAVLGELQAKGWRLPAGPVLDFGCGSGVASRRVIAALGTEGLTALWLHDRSGMAVEFARKRAADAFPGLAVAAAGSAVLEGRDPIGTLVVSHVLSELPGRELRRLMTLAKRSQAVLWVEPGTSADSRALIEVREALRDQFQVLAPCTHRAQCGLLAAGNERHWCHHFARPPWEIFTDPEWAEFGRRMGVDLRSLPYSYLVLDRRDGSESPVGWSRVLGVPRTYKGYSKVFSCDAEGVHDLRLTRRVLPQVLDRLEDPAGPRLFRWRADGEDVVTVDAEFPLPSAGADSGDSVA